MRVAITSNLDAPAQRPDLLAKIRRNIRIEVRAGEAIRINIDRFRPLLRDAMVAGHLLGRRRAILHAKQSRKTVQLATAYDDAISLLQRRLAMTDDDIAKLGRLYDPAVNRVLGKLQTDLIQRVNGVILQTAQQGLHVRSGVKLIRETLSKAGVTPAANHQLEQIFRTQTMLAYSAGRFNQLKAPEIQDILWGFKYVTVGDDRVRPNHVALDGTTLPKDHPLWHQIWTPNGYNCRCQIIELYDPEDEVAPPQMAMVEGVQVRPAADNGWGFNPGEVFRDDVTLASDPLEDRIEPISRLTGFKTERPDLEAREMITATVREIGNVHKLPRNMHLLPRWEILDHPGVENGFYTGSMTTGMPMSIGLNTHRNSFPRLTILEEFAHYFDHQDIDDDKYGFASSSYEPMSYLLHEIAVSDQALELRERLRSATTRQLAERISSRLTRRELFARAYAQFIAMESGNSDIIRELDVARGRVGLTRLLYWDDQSFSLIAGQMRQLLIAKGLM